MPVDIIELGATLREARGMTITQKELGLNLGISPNVISGIELGTYSKGVTDKHRIIATHFGIEIQEDEEDDMTEEKAATNGNGNGALTEITQARIIQLHKPAGFDPETDGMITCLLALSEMNKEEAVRTLKYLNMRFAE